MILLRLTPEVRRLRRVAKACAAGELSRLEYREARREVIEGFMEEYAQGMDRTIPREELDITLRRSDYAESDAYEPPPSLRWLVIFALFALASLASQLAFAFEISAVKDRDPNPNNSPRVVVSELVWHVPEELESINREQAAEFVDARLQDVRAANAALDHGFSSAELDQVGRFLDAIGVHDEATEFSEQDLQDLAALVARQKEQRGVSVAQLEEIASELQQYVRDQGYPLARAYLPQQTVVDGQIELGVLVGRLASVQVDRANANVATRFDSIVGRPIQDVELETKLNRLNRLPGLRAQASFVPGPAVGEASMLLSMADEPQWRGFVQLDNYGIDALGEERLSLLGQLNNPRGVGDRIELSMVGSMNPTDQKRGTISYETPVLGGRYDTQVGLSRADLDWQEGRGVAGRGMLFDASLSDTRLFTRTKRREYQYVVGMHDLQWDGLLDQRSWFVGAGVKGHKLWDDHKIALEGEAQAVMGRLDATRLGQDDTFWLARFDATAWAPWDVPWVNARAKAVIGIHAQTSPDLLPTTQRIAMTGASANRGFAQIGLLVDRAILIKGELLFAAPIGQIGLFIDAGYGERNNEFDDWYELTSLGVSWQARLFSRDTGYLTSKLSVATPLSHEGSQASTDFNSDFIWGAGHADTQVFWSLQYSH